VKCSILPGMVTGIFNKMHAANDAVQGFFPGCDREFIRGQAVLSRVQTIKPGAQSVAVSLSVNMQENLWNTRFQLTDVDLCYFVPFKGENWSLSQLGPVDSDAKTKAKKEQTWVQRPRNIRHPNFASGPHQVALSIIEASPMGNVLFRASKRFDTLLAYLKVRQTDINPMDNAMDTELCVPVNKCFRVFTVREVHTKSDGTKDTVAFELAKDLWVDGVSYRSLDEIIAVHMDPIMENLRLLQEHKKFGIRDGRAVNRMLVREAIFGFTKIQPGTIHYAFAMSETLVGHGVLIWALGGRTPKDEIVEVTPNGFCLWGRPFDTLSTLIAWFKNFGWRSASEYRKEWYAAFEKRRLSDRDIRGRDVLEEQKKKRKAGEKLDLFNNVATGSGGLQTPNNTAGPGTPTNYQPEAAAATPRGLSTPTYGGMSTPRNFHGAPPTPVGAPSTPRGAPATPRGMAGPMGVPATPQQLGGGVRIPQTPVTAFAAGHHAAPMTPAALQPGGSMSRVQPMTPANLGVVSRTQPMTPAFHGFGGAGRSAASGTPAGPPPGTPAFMYAAAGTPSPGGVRQPTPGFAAYATAATPSPGTRYAGTPGMATGMANPGTPQFQRHAGTPGAQQFAANPGTPQFQRYAGTPGGAHPGTPGAASGTPAASAGFVGVPMTPGIRMPAGGPPATPAAFPAGDGSRQLPDGARPPSLNAMFD